MLDPNSKCLVSGQGQVICVDCVRVRNLKNFTFSVPLSTLLIRRSNKTPGHFMHRKLE